MVENFHRLLWLRERLWPARRSKVRVLGDAVVSAALGGLGLFSIAGTVSAWFPSLEAFGNLQGHFAASGLLLMLAALSLRLRGWVVVAGAIFGLNLAAAGIRLAPVETCPVQMAATGQQPVRIMTYNISRKKEHARAVERLIGRHRPDVVFLQEFDSENAALLDDLHAQYPYQSVCEKNAECDLVLLSRFPLRSRGVVGDDEIELLKAKVVVGTHEFLLLGTHFERATSGRAQLAQFQTVTRITTDLPANAAVIGDFNSAPWSANMSRYTQEAGVCVLSAFQATWPSWLGPFGIPIDHMFLKPGLGLLSVAALGDTGSDHRALMATIGIP